MAKMITIDEKHPHIALVAVAVKEPRLVNGAWVEVDNTVEVPVRKAHWDLLSTVTKKDAYAKECAEFHSAQGANWEAKRNARRALWDTDDKAKADADALAAKAAEEAKFIVTPQGFVRDKEGVITHVQVRIQHHGLTFSGAVAYDADKVVFERNCRDAFTKYEAAVNEEEAALAAFAIG